MALVETYQNQFECPECGGKLAHDNGETYCDSCGLVVEDGLRNHRLKWRKDPQEGGRGQGQTTSGSHDKGLGSQISFGGTTPDNHRTFERLRDWQTSKQYTGYERNRRKGLGEVHRLISALDFPDSMSNPASELFTTAHEAGIADGRGLDAVAAAAVYITSKQHRHIRDMSDWVDYISVEENIFRRTITVMQRELDVGFLPITPSNHIPSVLDNFRVTDDQRNQIAKIVKAIEDKGAHSGKRPKNLVGGVVYLVLRVTQQDVADALDISRQTVRKNKNHVKESIDMGNL